MSEPAKTTRKARARSPASEPGAKIPVWSWRDAVWEMPNEIVAPNTKYVCQALSKYLSDAGTGCFPSVKELMRITGLSNRTVATHLAAAEEAGLVEIRRKAGTDGRYLGTFYLPKFPANCALPTEAARDMRDVHGDAEPGEVHVKELHVDNEVAPGLPRVKEAHVDRVKELHVDRVNLLHEPREPVAEIHVKNFHGEIYQREIPKEPPTQTRVRAREISLEDGTGYPGDHLLAGLREDARHEGVVEGLIAPLLQSTLTLRPEHTLAWMRAFRDDLAAEVARRGGLSSAAMGRAASRIRLSRSLFPNSAQVVAALDEPANPRVVVRRGTPEFAAWLAHFRSADPKLHRIIEGLGSGLSHDSWQVESLWPPGHDQAAWQAKAEVAA